MKLYVMTHCESCYNKRAIFTGWIDSKLTPKGHEHAKEMAKLLHGVPVHVAYTSPLTRAKETLSYIIADHPEAKVLVDRRIIERDYGELSGKSKVKYEREHPDLFPLYHRSYDVAPPGGESMKTVEERVLDFVSDVVALIRRERINVLVVAHSNSIRPIIRHFEHLSPDEMMQIEHIRHRLFTYSIEDESKEVL